MSKPLIDVVLPRLAKNLYRELERYRAGQVDESTFSKNFEGLLQRHHAWLTARGVSDVRAALAIHAAVLVLSSPGLRAEAAEHGLPLEIVEFRAIREAAGDVAQNYEIPVGEAIRVISTIVSRFGN